MNILAIDYGLKRVGVAVGSTDSGIAFTRPAFQNGHHLVDELLDFMKAEDIQQVLLGLPTKLSGEAGDIEEAVRTFATALTERTNVPIEWKNEQFSSKMAQQKLQEMQLKASEQIAAKKSGERDSLAALVLLQEWLDEEKFH